MNKLCKFKKNNILLQKNGRTIKLLLKFLLLFVVLLNLGYTVFLIFFSFKPTMEESKVMRKRMEETFLVYENVLKDQLVDTKYNYRQSDYTMPFGTIICELGNANYHFKNGFEVKAQIELYVLNAEYHTYVNDILVCSPDVGSPEQLVDLFRTCQWFEEFSILYSETEAVNIDTVEELIQEAKKNKGDSERGYAMRSISELEISLTYLEINGAKYSANLVLRGKNLKMK